MNSTPRNFKLKSGFSSALTTATLLISAATLVDAGESKAVDECYLASLSTCTLTMGDKVISDLVLDGYVPPPATGTNDYISLSESTGIWSLQTQFKGSKQFLTPATLKFKITVTDPTQVLYNTEINALGTQVFGGSILFTADQTASVPTSILSPDPIVSNNTMLAMASWGTVKPTMVNFTTSWQTSGNSQISSLLQTFTQGPPPTDAVPAPLPMFGAAAAFGFSRQLRSRIKKAATA